MLTPVGTRPIPALQFGRGRAVLDPVTGGATQFEDPAHPDRRYLLSDDPRYHSPDHCWGSGHVVTDAGTARWQTPSQLSISEEDVEAHYETDFGLTLTVRRTGGAELTEVYEFRNGSRRPLTLRSIGIQTPFADLYEDSPTALTTAVNAHVFTAGEWAWAYAVPMSGNGAILGLSLVEGALWSYGVESRNTTSSSNFRGHLVLNVTDEARAPESFGGQPTIHLEPGERYRLVWTLGWYDDVAHFLEQVEEPARFERLAAPIGEPIRLRTGAEVRATSPWVSVTRADAGETVTVTASRPGTYDLAIGGARTQVLFHRPVRQIVTARIDYILAHQRPRERRGTLAHAFVPVDIRTKIRTYANGWLDWADGSERIGMALMMQRARLRGWGSVEVDEALADWARFAREHLIEGDGTPRRGTFLFEELTRLYDMPWLALFFIDRHRYTGAAADLDQAALVLARGFELGIGRFLAIGLPEACAKTVDALTAAGRTGEAGALREGLLTSAAHFLALGIDLPAHEVSYEQSMVAPLVELMIFAHRFTGEDRYLQAIADRLPWLLAFSGPQQHVRLHGVPIRHWDGYWFGLRRQWGDVFPHHWSSLTAAVLARLPQELKSEETDDLARAILRSNLTSYFDDGSATCAFVFPATVDGEAAHVPDPLANDQEWPLAIWLELAESEGIELT